MNSQDKSTKDAILEIISQQTGLELDQITLDSEWEELGIDMVETFPKIVTQANIYFDHQLPLRDQQFINELKASETIGDFIILIETEVEL